MKNIFDRNTLLGIAIIAMMVTAYFFYTKNRLDNLQKQEAIKSSFDADSTKNSANNNDTTILDTTSNIAAIAPITDTTSATSLPAGEDYTLRNDLLEIKVNTTGAQMHDAKLYKHLSYNDKEVLLLPKEKTHLDYYINGINTAAQSYNVVSKSDTKLVLAASNGVQVTFVLKPDAYSLNQTWMLPNGTKIENSMLKAKTEMERQEVNTERERMYSAVYYMKQGEDVIDNLSKTANEELAINEPTRWVSFAQQFFNVSIVPTKGIAMGNYKTYHEESDSAYVKKYSADVEIPADESLSINYYIGPTDYKLLKKEGNELQEIVPLSPNFILFRWMKIFNIYLIIPMFDFLSRFISNYGIIILVMTIIIKLLTAPLSYKTYKSGVAMRILKPELDKLRKKYGDDQQEYAKAQMKLFNQSGVSPLGGCMPMLLQMPILFAMFNFFPSSIELRHQPFLWATDLSTYDTLFNLPFKIPFYGNHVSGFALLMTITQIFTTKYSQSLQPSSPQADQMKMMTYLMPVVFLFMFNSFPAALTFYYLCQNVLSVFQQWLFTSYIIDENKVREEIELAKTQPKKQNKFQQKMADIMNQAEEQRKMQQNNKSK